MAKHCNVCHVVFKTAKSLENHEHILYPQNSLHFKKQRIFLFRICRHMCVLPNHQFYFYILTVSSALLCAYILCNLYNLVRQQQHSDQRPLKCLFIISFETVCGANLTSIQWLQVWFFYSFLTFSVLDSLATDGSDVQGDQKIQRGDEHR